MSNRKLKIVVHGEWGAGKSYFADTAPGPKLILDAEGGVDFTPSRKTLWDPRQPIPEGLTEDDAAVVEVTDMDVIYKVHQWLTQFDHPFRSLIVDSLTELQMRQKDRIKPAGQRMMQNDWGELTDRTIALIRAFRDYTMGVHPLDVVVMVCGSAEKGQDHPIVRPMLQGSAAEKILGHVDVGMFLSIVEDEEGNIERLGQFVQVNGVAAKDRTGKLGTTLRNPTIPELLDMIYGPVGPKGDK